MNKEINELDRMIIGVREWALQQILDEAWKRREAARDLDEAIAEAKKLEEYVLRDIPANK